MDLSEEVEKAMASIESKLPPSLLPTLSHPLLSVFNIIVVSIFIFVFGVQMKQPMMLKMQRLLKKAGVEISVDQTPSATAAANLPACRRTRSTNRRCIRGEGCC